MNRLNVSSIIIFLSLAVVTFVINIALHINGRNQQLSDITLDIHNLNQKVSRLSEHALYQDSEPRVERALK